MRCWVRKITAREVARISGDIPVIIPADETGQDDFEKLRWDQPIRADLVQPRNGGLHRKAFALLGLVWPHVEGRYATKDNLRAAMTIAAGFTEQVVNPRTEEVLLYPKSWEFSRMDDVEFRDLYNRLVDVALILVQDSTREGWEQDVDQLVRM